MIKCIAYCDFEKSTPAGLLYDEFLHRVVASLNDHLFFFDLKKFTQFYSKIENNDKTCKTDFSIQNLKEICFNKSQQLGGNIRNIRKNKFAENANKLNNYFVVNIKDYPLKIYDFNGKICQTIYLKNELDEIDNLYSLDFVISDNFNKYILLAGSKNRIYFSDLINSTKSTCIKFKLNKHNKYTQSQNGIISSLSLKTRGIGSLSIFASGTFSKNIFIHDLKDKDSQIHIFDRNTQIGAVTELYWLENDNLDENFYIDYHLISGHRNSSHFFIWDVRKPNQILFKIERNNLMNCQRFSINYHFDQKLNNQFLLSYGDSKGCLHINKLYFDQNNFKFSQENSLLTFKLEEQSIPFIEHINNQNLIITLSGERNFNIKENSSLKIWKYTD